MYDKNPIYILALDTVFKQCSVALLKNDCLIADATILGDRGQTEIILPMIDKLLSDNKMALSQIDVLAFNQGPGAFSGIRINTAVVQALSFAYDIACVGVSSLHALAYHAKEQINNPKNCTIAAAIDARQNEVYFCEYVIDNLDGIKMINKEKLLAYHSLVNADIIIGDGADLLQNNNAKKITTNPTAIQIGKIGYQLFNNNKAVNAKNALPVYLRHNAWKTLSEQRKKYK